MRDVAFALLGAFSIALFSIFMGFPEASSVASEIRSKTPIDPELHIVVVQDSLDTTFVYKKP